MHQCNPRFSTHISFCTYLVSFKLQKYSVDTKKTLSHLVVLVTMTRGVMVLLFACMLIVITARVSSLESDLAVAMYPPGMAPAYAPEKPPRMAPAYTPEEPRYPHAPEKAPVYPPTKSVAPTPEPEAPKRGCDGLCLDYCKPILTPKKRMCQRVCTECCAKCDCVPEKGATCKNWDVVLYHGVSVRCP
ncbi:hypothetical protein RHMOL_Rhmol10G0035000 [Rhododendron molle]|uniref:Uncharacterized protein n=1 Tax=Rhododendron molle TaxID=49168 RepID=A0ACC0LZP2_RHOML|nr:hypothetical protein RHMOL_Rhmol10G0035000 [Rhododendron molle]